MNQRRAEGLVVAHILMDYTTEAGKYRDTHDLVTH